VGGLPGLNVGMFEEKELGGPTDRYPNKSQELTSEKTQEGARATLARVESRLHDTWSNILVYLSLKYEVFK